jgi:hypothetical protein
MAERNDQGLAHSTNTSEDSFRRHYAAILGEDRWQNSLYPALTAPTKQCVLVNRFVPANNLGVLSNTAPEVGRFEDVTFPTARGGSQIRCLVQKPNRDNEEGTAPV